MPPFFAHAPGAAEGIASAVYTTSGGDAQGRRWSGRGLAHVRECRRRKPAVLTDEALGARAYCRGSAGAGASDTHATPEARPALIRAAYRL